MRVIKRPSFFFRVITSPKIILGVGALAAVTVLTPIVVNKLTSLDEDFFDNKEEPDDFEAYDGDEVSPFVYNEGIVSMKQKYEEIIQDVYRQKQSAEHEIRELKEKVAVLEQSIKEM